MALKFVLKVFVFGLDILDLLGLFPEEFFGLLLLLEKLLSLGFLLDGYGLELCSFRLKDFLLVDKIVRLCYVEISKVFLFFNLLLVLIFLEL